eukprot:2419027-Pleurochrysis_carterae.AAC.1
MTLLRLSAVNAAPAAAASASAAAATTTLWTRSRAREGAEPARPQPPAFSLHVLYNSLLFSVV